MKRRLVVWSGSAAVLAVAAIIGVNSWFPVDPRTNVILITLDTTRADHLGCYGYERAVTPTIDELAQRGTLFENAYTTVPLTLPAHASMLTGLYPFEHGLFTNGSHGLPEQIPTLTQILASHGYSTAAFIASFVLNRKFGLDRGFETYDDNVDGMPTYESPVDRKRSADQVVDRAIAWLTNQNQNQKPFFCWLHLFDPHAEYLPHRETFGDKFQSNPYDAEIAFVDLQLKRLIEFLKSRRLQDRTMIVIVGDHGEGLKEHRERWHGYMLYNSTLRVPLIICRPSKAKDAHRVSDPVSVVDLAPTILDCLDLPALKPVRGRSLKPMLLGETLPLRACYAVANEIYLEEGWAPLSCLITGDWKCIQTTKPELYDLQSDPAETTNLAESKPDTLQQMQQELQELEASGVRQEGQTVSLSEREQKNLAGLGYLGLRRTAKESTAQLPDLKDMLDAFDATQGAMELCIRGETEAAIPPLYQLISSAPRYLAPRLLLAKVLAQRGKPEEAETQYLSILDIDPDNKDAHTALGNLLASQNQFERALKHLQKALEDSPLSSSLHMSLGKVLSALKRPREAAAHFRTAEKLLHEELAERKLAKKAQK